MKAEQTNARNILPRLPQGAGSNLKSYSPTQLPFVMRLSHLQRQRREVVIVAMVGHRLALNWTARAMRRARVDTGTQILVKRAISAAFFTVTLLFVLGILGFNSTGLLTLAGAVGLAFSLAIQDILKNFFSGVYLLLERPFRVGDTIRVKDQQGVVENIRLRPTELRSPAHPPLLVPNA